MHNDPLLAMAYGIYSQKGVYALVLGPGVSKSANVPSNRVIFDDLIVKAFCRPAGEYPPEPGLWYEERFQEEPDIGKLLGKLAKTPAERNLLLRSYFEKSDNDVKGGKEPATAHRAIARLVKNGYIKVIITTNLDRLLERALRDEGIVPDIVTDSAQADSVIPLVHSKCVIVKINGDYMDISAETTLSGLESNANGLSGYVERILDEFGIIVCGWSARRDAGLQKAFLNCRTRRFAAYWLHLGKLTEEAERLIAFRKAETLEISGADDFFEELEGMVDSIARNNAVRHPLAVDAACERIKQWLPHTPDIIRLHDMVINEAGYAAGFVKSEDWPERPKPEEIEKKIRDMDAAAVRIVSLLAIGCYWGEDGHDMIWKKTLEILMFGSERLFRSKLHLYLPLQALYAALISALANDKYNLAFLVLNGCFHSVAHKRVAVSRSLHASNIMEHSVLNYALDLNNEVPVSERLFEVLRVPCMRVIHAEDVYERIFDKAEYLIYLNFKYLNPEQPPPSGRFSIKRRGAYVDTKSLLDDDIAGLRKAGFFGGDAKAYNNLLG